MRVLVLGGSRNIGYCVTQRLLSQGHTITLLLRKPDILESDLAMSGYIRNGKAKLVRGDGLVRDDLQRAWDTAKGDDQVDLVFFGIGGDPGFSPTKGFTINPPDLTTRSMSTLLSVIQSSTTPTTRPKLVTISSNGLDERSHSLLPLPWKVYYGWLLRLPHADKVGLEANIRSATSSEGWLSPQNMVLVRPSVLTSGKCLADEKPDAYRVGEELTSAWVVSRADIAHFVVEKVLADWERWAGKAWVVSY